VTAGKLVLPSARGGRYTDAMATRRVTVVIPTYNQSALLARCLKALAAQTDTDFSVVVVDDGSTDNTGDVVRRLPLPFPVTLVTLENGGPARARNLGIALADGDWVAFLDDDVVPLPGWMAAVRAHIDASARVLVGQTTSTTLAIPDVFSHQIRVVSAPPGPFPSCNFAADRRLFDEIGGFDAGFPYPAYEDTDWACRARASGVKPVFVPTMHVDHPPRPGSYRAQLRRVRHQASAVRFALKHRRIGAVFGLTDSMQYLGALGVAAFFDRLAMWPFLLVFLTGFYVRAADYLKLRSYTPKEALLAATLPLLTPWLKLPVVARALVNPKTWRGISGPHPTPFERVPDIPASAHIERRPPQDAVTPISPDAAPLPG
jgi:GT2 family glycosyltransferase